MIFQFTPPNRIAAIGVEAMAIAAIACRWRCPSAIKIGKQNGQQIAAARLCRSVFISNFGDRKIKLAGIQHCGFDARFDEWTLGPGRTSTAPRSQLGSAGENGPAWNFQRQQFWRACSGDAIAAPHVLFHPFRFTALAQSSGSKNAGFSRQKCSFLQAFRGAPRRGARRRAMR
jgi:hypothetical protein